MLPRLTLALLLAACGPQGSDTAASTGEASTTTASTTDTPTTGGPATPAVCDEIDEYPIFTDDTAQCVDFPSVPATGELEVGVINQRDEVVFVRGVSNAAPGYLRVTGSSFGRELHAPYICGMDPPSCDELIAGDDPGCLLNDKLSPPIRIEPGQRHRFVWEPFVVFPVQLPAACQPQPAMDATCTTGRPPTPGPYTLEITYAHADDCEGACECDPGPDGGCILDLSEANITGTPNPVQAKYDGFCKIVDLVIE